MTRKKVAVRRGMLINSQNRMFILFTGDLVNNQYEEREALEDYLSNS